MAPSVWNSLDRLLDFNIVIAHIPGRVNYAAEFFSKMEHHKTATMSVTLTDIILVRKMEINTEAQNPEVELNVLFDTKNFCGEINNDKTGVLKKLGYNEDYKKRQSHLTINKI